jgi:Fe2+ or Zn2+ uptake regulation protein
VTAQNNEQIGFGQLPADTLHLSQRVSNLPTVLYELNALVKQGVIKDYAIGGGYAVMYYGIPYSTFDLDVLVLLGSEEDFHNLYSHYR